VEENGLLDAFRTTQQGGNATLFDQMLNGLNIPGRGCGQRQSITGSSAMRRWSSTVSFLANNDVRGLANFLNQSNFGTGEIGGLIRRAGLPENFIVTNPQYGSQTFGGAALVTNLGNSTYHSMHIAGDKRLSQGFTTQATYSWSRNAGNYLHGSEKRASASLCRTSIARTSSAPTAHGSFRSVPTKSCFPVRRRGWRVLSSGGSWELSSA
jgi:hypothetical protein